ncbi:helix-turn-helix domain-containing protein [Actinomadura rayongensis]|uniref:Helix-turn-helix domain-containing protein n=1 Tax=Actinomadura rayongensis TaxID=1429076 RepID=A0A6I4WA52_9ACTN|nr:helix-turn-helix transcriptional regulator [Actinomadura rayongensis]MXQ67729.1 helix-turn-helix domain-containing protein [Actinomadura rayongensis]
MRKLKGESQADLARALFVSRELVTAWERQRSLPDLDHCAKLDEHFGTGELFRVRWAHCQREHIKTWFEKYARHEAQATEIRTFQPLYVPGLLQTEGYMRITWPKGPVDGELITRRTEQRGGILRREDPPHLFAVIDEGALVRPLKNPQVMRQQLQYLLEMGELPRVHIQAVRMTDGWHYGFNGALVSLTMPDLSRVGYVEAQFGGRLIQDPVEVADLSIRFDEIRAEALSESATRDLIRETMETMQDDPVA